VLQKSERFNASLLQHSPNPISVINTDTTISYVNPAFEKLTGFPSRKVIGLKAPYPGGRKNTLKRPESHLKSL
jgi:PAS domain S-box-containing protein